jgi:hypothetical protein
MKKICILIAVLLAAVAGRAQTVGGPLFGCTGAINVGTAWNSGTSAASTQALLNNTPVANIVVQLDQTTTITGGAITFQGSYDGINWVSVPVAQVLNPQTYAQLTNPYTLVASTNQPFLIVLGGFVSVRLNLSTAITGSGAVTPYYVPNCNQQTAALLGTLNVNLGQVSGSAPGTSNPLQVSVVDGTNGPAAVKAASTAAAAGDKSMVVQISPNTPAIATQDVPQTANTSATSICLLTANTTAASCKASAGNLYGFTIYNPNSSLCVLQVFNTSSVTLGTTTELLDIPVLPTGGNNLVLKYPINFSADIYVASTTAAHGASTCSTGMLVNLFYE